MKQIIFILFIFSISSCNSQDKKKEEIIIESVLNNLYEIKKDKLPVLYYSIENNDYVYENVLLKIENYKPFFQNDKELFGNVFNKTNIENYKEQLEKNKIFNIRNIKDQNIKRYDSSISKDIIILYQKILLTIEL